MMRRIIKHVSPLRAALAALVAATPSVLAQAEAIPPLRPPAAPLIVNNPYLSVWSCTDRLTDDWPRHWTGTPIGMCGMARIDGEAVRFIGREPRAAAAMTQTSLSISATQTRYTFEHGGVELAVSFISPLLADDADLASRAVSYITVTARATDGAPHRVALYLDCSGEWAVHDPAQPVRWSRARASGLDLLSIGSADQPVLERRGDATRIDWGNFYLGVAQSAAVTTAVAGHNACRGAFEQDAPLPDDDLRQPRPANDDWPVLAVVSNFGRIGEKPASETFLLAYDDGFCVEYFGRRLRPYWARAGKTFAAMVGEQLATREAIATRCDRFDRKLRSNLVAVGGEKYARLCELAYRQTMAAHIIAADFDGTMLMFPKENSSNGCIGTVDVFFPSAPFYLLLGPEMLEAQVRPVLDYAAGPRWKFPFAPHDLGTYPLANGQVYGGGETGEENQMPVEESGNMIILVAALARVRGNADLAAKYWPQLTRWVEYLRDHGLDPANQLCTDDFAGHLARNANLAAKAIVAIGCYAELCRARGLDEDAKTWRECAERYAAEWMKLAGDGDHTVLAYGAPGTWSLKYNLYWDRALELNLFPPELAAGEVACYLSKNNRYGAPLDSRDTYTKLDFVAWAACLAVDRAQLEALLNPLYDFAHATPDRVPLSDWYRTTDAKNMGFRARSVVGGIYAPAFADSLRPAAPADPAATAPPSSGERP